MNRLKMIECVRMRNQIERMIENFLLINTYFAFIKTNLNLNVIRIHAFKT